MVKPIVQDLIDKTYQELKTPQKPIQNSRIWQSTNGYIFLIPWSNASLLRVLIRRFTDSLPKSYYRFKNQIDDAGRSVVANIEEGFARSTTSEYIQFLGYSQGSLKEVKGDIQRARQDGLLSSITGSKISDLGIDYREWHEALKTSVISKPQETTGAKGDYRNLEEFRGNYGRLEEIRGSYRNLKEFRGDYREGCSPLKSSKVLCPSFKFLYPLVDNLQPQDLTYEIFIELINKTDWHLRRLVESLERKLSGDRKFYQVEQARLRGRYRIQ
jgi:four helix bundle protein